MHQHVNCLSWDPRTHLLNIAAGAKRAPDAGDQHRAHFKVVGRRGEVCQQSRLDVIVEGVEADARAQGWPAELLWNAGDWDCPRGLAAVLDESDVIAEVTPDFIEIVKSKRSILRFQRRVS